MNLCQNWLGNSTVPHGLDLNSLIGYSSRSLGRNFPLMSSTLADTQKDGLSWETPRTPIQGLPMSPLKQGGQTACQWPQHPQRIFPKEVELLVFRSESINCVHHFCLTVLVKGADSRGGSTDLLSMGGMSKDLGPPPILVCFSLTIIHFSTEGMHSSETL